MRVFPESLRHAQGILGNIVGVILAGGWLFNHKTPPWANFYHEMYVVLGMVLLLGIFFFHVKPKKIKISVAVFLPLAFFCVVLFQFGQGLIVWFGDVVVAAIYLLGIFLALLFAQNIDDDVRDKLTSVLALSLLMAGLGTLFLQLFQLTGLHVEWIRGTDPRRPSGNIGQPNHVGTLGILSLISAFYLRKAGLVSKHLLLAVSTILLFSIALTGSRAAIVGLVVLALFRLFAGRRGTNASHEPYFLWLLFGLGCAYLLVWVFRYWYPPSDIVNAGLSPELVRMDSSGRIQAWSMLLHQVLQAPWWGYGWGQTAMAHLVADTFTYPLGAHFQNAHNIFLEFLLWFGIPLGIVASYVLLWVTAKSLRCESEANLLASGSIIILMNHSLFEHPLFYGYFLAYFCVFLGLNVPTFTVSHLRWKPVLPWACLSVGIFVLMLLILSRDHRVLEQLFRRWGINNFTSSTNFTYEKVDLVFMRHWEHLIKYSYRGPPSVEVLAHVNEAERVVMRFPTTNIIFNYALILQQQGRRDEAQQWLRRGCAVHSIKHCMELRRRWIDAMRMTGVQPNAVWPVTVFDLPKPVSLKQ